jgi:type III secretion system low calcium response chaperone LcrH/SycD
MDIDKVAESLLEEDSYYQKQANDLVSGETLKQRHKEEIKEALKNQHLSDAIIRGFEWIRRDIIEVLAQEELEPFFHDLSKINQDHVEHPPPTVAEKLASHKPVTMQELFELSDDTMRKIYALGHQYFQKKEYDKAIDIFSIVTAFNPYISDFWNALALCYQAKQEWKLAIEAFTLACQTNDQNIAPLISRAECCLKLNLLDEAHREIEFASKIIERNPALDEKWGDYIRELKRSA